VTPPVESPCIKVCALDAGGRVCLGCFRSVEEIGFWSEMSDPERLHVLARIPERRAQFEASRPPGTLIACERCGALFACGANDAARPCWCAGYPAVTPSGDNATCLCPACLAAAATS
jgi:uncharacterized protein